MPKKLSDQEKIRRIFKELPYNSKEYIEDVYCSDVDFEDLTMKQFKEALELSIDKLKMDADEAFGEEWEEDYKKQLKQAEKAYKKYQKWLPI